MYAKIFTAIFDSSLAENYEVRHVFEDLLKMADRTGAVNMTQEAIARRANVPLEKIRFGIEQLCKPDPRSQNKEHDGRRLIPLDAGRDWGWMIVSYSYYRGVQDREALRESWRASQAKVRKAKKKAAPKPPKESLTWSAGSATEKAFCDQLNKGNNVTAAQIVDGISQPATPSPASNENTALDQ